MRFVVKKDFFKPDDFQLATIQIGGTSDMYLYTEDAALVANEKLNKLIESFPVVYGAFDGEKVTQTFGQIKSVSNTHIAKLAFIEEIKKECVKHDPNYVYTGPSTQDWKAVCKHCKVELQATWSEKK